MLIFTHWFALYIVLLNCADVDECMTLSRPIAYMCKVDFGILSLSMSADILQIHQMWSYILNLKGILNLSITISLPEESIVGCI